MKKIGILGGGQLGMLLAQSIIKLGAEALIYDPDPQAPACRAVKHSINAGWQDKKALAAFLSNCDRATYEFENVPYESLVDLHQATPIFPALHVLKITQNRIKEKEFLRAHGLPHVPYVVADNFEQLEKQIDDLRFPVIAKSATGGYDGKSQIYCKTRNEIVHLFSQGEEKSPITFPLIVEQAIDLHMEVSCITARGVQGEEVGFPIFENMHSNHILDMTLVPARISNEMARHIQELATKAAQQLGVVGLLCTEFFIGRKSNAVSSPISVGEFDIYINEFAPRPHNSGHVTMASCTLSQFDVLARILLDLPLAVPIPASNYSYCMANMLGDIWLAQGTENGDKINLGALANVEELMDIVLYGKVEARSGRKMGHLVTRAPTIDKAEAAAKLAREKLKSSSCLN